MSTKPADVPKSSNQGLVGHEMVKGPAMKSGDDQRMMPQEGRVVIRWSGAVSSINVVP